MPENAEIVGGPFAVELVECQPSTADDPPDAVDLVDVGELTIRRIVVQRWRVA
jgi:hypothetical protein